MSTASHAGIVRMPLTRTVARAPGRLLSQLVTFGLALWLALTWMLFAVRGSNHLVNAQTMVLATVVVALLGALHAFLRRAAVLVVLISLLTFALFLSRITALILDPTGFARYPGFYPDAGAVNRTLVYVAWGALAAGLGSSVGVRIGGVLAGGRRPSSRPFATSVRVFWLVGMFAAGLLWVGVWSLGLANYSDAKDFGALGYVLRFVSPDIAAMLGFVVAGEMWSRIGRHDRILLGVFFAFYTSGSLLAGSRGVLVNLVTFWLSYQLAKRGNPRLEGRTVRRVLTLVLITAVAVFPIATTIRYVRNDRSVALVVSPSELARRAISLYREQGTRFGISAFAQRVSALDPLARIVHGGKVDFPASDVKAYVLNGVLPGDPYPQVLSQGRRFNVEYRAWSPALARTQYHSEVWTLWGLAYAYAGWRGGLLIVFAAMVLAGLAYRLLSAWRSRLALPVRAGVLFVLFQGFLNSGVDTWLLSSFTTLVSLGLLLIPLALTAPDPAGGTRR